MLWKALLLPAPEAVASSPGNHNPLYNLLCVLRAEISSVFLFWRRGAEPKEHKLTFAKQAGDFHSNQERKGHALTLEFTMQVTGWRAACCSASHS